LFFVCPSGYWRVPDILLLAVQSEYQPCQEAALKFLICISESGKMCRCIFPWGRINIHRGLDVSTCYKLCIINMLPKTKGCPEKLIIIRDSIRAKRLNKGLHQKE
jgi:hypothetical protein